MTMKVFYLLTGILVGFFIGAFWEYRQEAKEKMYIGVYRAPVSGHYLVNGKDVFKKAGETIP